MLQKWTIKLTPLSYCVLFMLTPKSSDSPSVGLTIKGIKRILKPRVFADFSFISKYCKYILYPSCVLSFFPWFLQLLIYFAIVHIGLSNAHPPIADRARICLLAMLRVKQHVRICANIALVNTPPLPSKSCVLTERVHRRNVDKCRKFSFAKFSAIPHYDIWVVEGKSWVGQQTGRISVA